MGRNLPTTTTMVGQTCRFAQISPPASAAMLAEPFWGYAHKNIALVLVEVWAVQQRRPTLVESKSSSAAVYPAGTKVKCWRLDDFWFIDGML